MSLREKVAEGAGSLGRGGAVGYGQTTEATVTLGRTPLLCHAKSPRRSSATSLTHTDSLGEQRGRGCNLVEGGVSNI